MALPASSIVDRVLAASCAGDAEYAARLNASMGYVHTVGLLVADDVLEHSVAQRKTLVMPLEGAYVLRIAKPVKCCLFSYGRVGCLVPNAAPVSVTTDFDLSSRREDTAMLGRLMQSLDPALMLGCLRQQWYFVDLAKAEARFVRAPGQAELSRHVAAKPGPKAKPAQPDTAAAGAGQQHPERMKREAPHLEDFWAELERQEARSQAGPARPKKMLSESLRNFKRKQSGQRLEMEAAATRRAPSRSAARLARAYNAKYGPNGVHPPRPTSDDEACAVGPGAQAPAAKRARLSSVSTTSTATAAGKIGSCAEMPARPDLAPAAGQRPRGRTQSAQPGPGPACAAKMRLPTGSAPEGSELSAESPRGGRASSPLSPLSAGVSDASDVDDEMGEMDEVEDVDLFGDGEE